MPTIILIPGRPTTERRPWWAATPWERGALPWDVPVTSPAGPPPAGTRPAGSHPPRPAATVRGEAERLARRLAVARELLSAAATQPLPPQPHLSQPHLSQPRAPHPLPPQPRAAGASAQDISRADEPGARGSGAGAGTRGSGAGPRGAGAGARIDGADDEVCDLLRPTVDRLARLAELADALADGRLSEAEAAHAVAELSATQPVRRPR